MGRAYEVRKASIQKTGAAKAKLYSMYAREIYQAAKVGGTDPVSNVTLKRLIEKSKKEQVPSDIVKRAIDKVNSGIDENYDEVRYEIFGPSGSNLIVVCFTDNVNRSLSSIRTALNKCDSKMGAQGSVSYMYDHLSIVSFKGLSEEETLEALIENGIDIDDIEKDNENVVVYGIPQDLYKIKEVINTKLGNIEFDVDEITMLPKEKIKLSGDDLDHFKKLLIMLDDIEDVQNVYHNVEL
ncbi:MAG TPA: YebC/PmpR family DNA-binding transcriptional regulator [Tenericutes bacterium]|nr:YebC/PmpR family DNA-binding transcriptional regulator [Mycoplasmatota bacterium]